MRFGFGPVVKPELEMDRLRLKACKRKGVHMYPLSGLVSLKEFSSEQNL